MPDFHYTATDPSGRMVRGTLPAKDQHDLIAQLQQKKLYLISCVDPTAAPPAIPLPKEPTPAIETEPYRPAQDYFNAGNRPMTSKQRLFLGAVLASGIFIGLGRSYFQRRAPVKNELVVERLSHIQVGMTREQVEEYLGQATPGVNFQKCHYFLPPDALIEISYDETGGRANAANRILSPGIKVLNGVARR